MDRGLDRRVAIKVLDSTQEARVIARLEHPAIVPIYDAGTLRCTHLVRLHWPVNTVAFHPELPLVAIGSGAYDGGWLYEGELTILDLDTGRSVSLLDEERVAANRIAKQLGG